MRYYAKLDENNIVIATLSTSKTPTSEWIEVDNENVMGKKWNGSTFEEVPTKETEEPETTEVTNEDLLEILLAIGEKVGA